MIQAIMTLSTALVTFIFGLFVKKFDLMESKYIPVQNALIGIVAGLLAYSCKLYDNVWIAVVMCFIAAMGAGGTYDLSKTRGDSDEKTIE